MVEFIPAPTGDREAPLQALIIDSWFDSYLGVVSLVRVREGTVKKGDKIYILSTKEAHLVSSIGVFTPKPLDTGILEAGEVGFVIAGIKDIAGAPVGDTITHSKTPDVERIPGFKQITPQVYSGMFPVDSSDFEKFREALQLPLIYVGGLVSREGIERALDSGFELVQMARALVNDPAFVNKLREGDAATRSECDHRNYCIARMYSVDMKCCKHCGDLPRKIREELAKLP